MKAITTHFLILACVTSLVLPPGWCCLLIPTPSAATSSETQSVPCCAHCEVPRTHDGDPLPLSRGKSTELCECADRLATLVEWPTFDGDLAAALAETLPVTAAVSVPSHDAEWAAPRYPVPRLHVLHCIWLC